MTVGTDPGAPLTLGGSFLCTSWRTQGSPPPWAARNPRQGRIRPQGEQRPAEHPCWRSSRWMRPAGPSFYQKLPSVPLSYKSRTAFLFLVFTKGAEHGLGGRRGSLRVRESQPPPCPARAARGRTRRCRCHPARPGHRGLSPAQGKGRTPVPESPCAWGMASPGQQPPDPLPISSPLQFSPDPVSLLGCPLWGPEPRRPLTGMMGLGGDLLHGHPSSTGNTSPLINARAWGGFSAFQTQAQQPPPRLSWLRVPACQGLLEG